MVVPLNESRFARLDELEEAVGDGPLELEAVLDAFLRPAIEARGEAFRMVTARLFSDPPEVVSVLKKQHFGGVSDRFIPALERALPGREPEQVALDFQFVVGLMVFVISGQLESIPYSGPYEVPDAERLIERAVRFAAAGLRS